MAGPMKPANRGAYRDAVKGAIKKRRAIYKPEPRPYLQQSAHRHGEEVAPEALYPPGSPQFRAQKARLPRRAPRYPGDPAKTNNPLTKRYV